MTNGQKTELFLELVDFNVKNIIIDNIAKHYKISAIEAYNEITDNEAEHLCDYITGKERTATSLLMKRYGLF